MFVPNYKLLAHALGASAQTAPNASEEAIVIWLLRLTMEKIGDEAAGSMPALGCGQATEASWDEWAGRLRARLEKEAKDLVAASVAIKKQLALVETQYQERHEREDLQKRVAKGLNAIEVNSDPAVHTRVTALCPDWIFFADRDQPDDRAFKAGWYLSPARLKRAESALVALRWSAKMRDGHYPHPEEVPELLDTSVAPAIIAHVVARYDWAKKGNHYRLVPKAQ